MKKTQHESKAESVQTAAAKQQLEAENQHAATSVADTSMSETALGSAASPARHANLLTRAKATGAVQAQQLVNRLQRHYGNRYVQRVLDISRQGQGEAEVDEEVEQTINRKRGGGQSLDENVRPQMESAMNADFSGVRIHTDSESDSLNRQLNARAFTTGQDIFFRAGEHQPGSSSGRELLAHELTHVVQQTGGVRKKMSVSQPDDSAEQEADEVARTIIENERHSERASLKQYPLQRQQEEEEEETVSLKRREIQNNLQRTENLSVTDGTMPPPNPVMKIYAKHYTSRRSLHRLGPEEGNKLVRKKITIATQFSPYIQRDLRKRFSGQWGPAQNDLNMLYGGEGGVVDRQKGAITDFIRYARTPDQPSLAEQVLINGINMVLGAVIPGIGGVIKSAAQGMVRSSLRGTVGAIVDSMVDAGKNGAQSAVTHAWSRTAGTDTPIIKFTETQRRALQDIARTQISTMNQELARLLATQGDTDEWEAGDALYQSFQQSLTRAYNEQFNKMTDTWLTMQTGIIGAGARPGVLQITLSRRYPHQGTFHIEGGNLLGSGAVSEIRSRLGRRALKDIGIPKYIRMNGQMGWGIADCNWNIQVAGQAPVSAHATISAPRSRLERLTAGPQRVTGYGGHRSWGWPWLAAFHLGLDDLDHDDARNTEENRSAGAQEIWNAIKNMTPGSIGSSSW